MLKGEGIPVIYENKEVEVLDAHQICSDSSDALKKTLADFSKEEIKIMSDKMQMINIFLGN